MKKSLLMNRNDISNSSNNQESLPLVSVVIPAFCASRFISKTLRSVTSQTYGNLEIIVVDDGSTDNTVEIVEQAMTVDARIQLLKQENKGAASARNLAIKHSRGEFIAALDADDLWLPTYVEKLVECILAAPPAVGAVYSWSMDIDESDACTGQFHASNIDGDVYHTLICHYFPANSSCALIRRSCFDEVGSYSSEFLQQGGQGCEDWDLLIRVARHYEFRVVKEFLVLYRKWRESMSQAYDSMAKSQHLALGETVLEDPQVPRFLSSISLSLFYNYLAQQCISQKDPRTAMNWLSKAFHANWLVTIFRTRTYRSYALCTYLLVREEFFTPYSTNQPINAIVNENPNGKNLPLSADWNIRQVELHQPAHWQLWCKLISQDLLKLAICMLTELKRNRAGHSDSDHLEEKYTLTFAHPDKLANRIRLDSRIPELAPLSDLVSVSVIVPTYNRPNELRQCLLHLVAQKSQRQREIIVVDNDPDSGVALNIVSEFPGVKLIAERRKGASYARNAGILASTSDVCVFVDDDIVVPSQWLERLIAPLASSHVMAVTGNVLPYELDSPGAKLFEGYADGGFERGFERWQADSEWFHSHRIGGAKTWLLGGSGNAAVRREAFCNPEIGTFKTYLGAGMPSGGSEDSYLFYKIIKAGWTVAYEPTAYCWHKHRSDYKAVQAQLFNYSKGFVSYHLTTLFAERDLRSIPSLMHLPWWHLKRTILRIAGKSSHPIKIIAIEALGHMLGPIALVRSLRLANDTASSRGILPNQSSLDAPTSALETFAGHNVQ